MGEAPATPTRSNKLKHVAVLHNMIHVLHGMWMKVVMEGPGDRSSRILRGILDACLLTMIIERDRYGYEIAAGLRESGLDLVRDGTIYPLLSRLEHRGHLDSYVAPSASGPRRRYYRITPAGRSELERATVVWRHVSSGVNGILGDVQQPRRQGR